MPLTLVPATWREARAFVEAWHRHLPPPPGHKFSLGVVDDTDVLVGVAIVGRPVARALDDHRTLEVTRLATDGTGNACSKLLGAASRAARVLGYRRVITYTRDDEPGTSLNAAGWRVAATLPPRSGWNRRPGGADTGGIGRTRWEVP